MRSRRFAAWLLSVALAAALWLPCAHLLVRPGGPLAAAGSRVQLRDALARRQLALWASPERRDAAIAAMRADSAEWDFMGRTYLVLALANLALERPARRAAHLRAIDAIVDETLRLEAAHGHRFFLLGYADARPWVSRPARSQFVDGEIALMMAARRLVEERPAYRAPLAERVATMAARMRRSPVLSAESYPDECWTFCNTIALAAIRLHDVLDRADHRRLLSDWVATARRRLVDRRTGLLVSSYRLDGHVLDGPEGSSIFMAAHALQVVDPAFARDQWDRARRLLLRRALGFGWATEWPPYWRGPADIDSGPTVPLLDAHAGASGLAVVGAAAFADDDALDALLASVSLAGFPQRDGGGLRFAATGPIGDAVLLYALSQGPLWREARTRARGAEVSP